MIEQFDRAEFEKALSFTPFGVTLIGAESGQLEYKIPIMSTGKCRKGHEVDCLNLSMVCPTCGVRMYWPEHSLKKGELWIKVFSSVSHITGRTNPETGADSIRLVLCYKNGTPVGKLGHHITRVKGWQRRLKDKVRDLWSLALSLPRCKCGLKAKICTSRSGKNKGKQFYLCPRCQFDSWIGWLEEV